MTTEEIEKISKLARNIISWGREDRHSIYAAKLVQELAQGAIDLISELSFLQTQQDKCDKNDK